MCTCTNANGAWLPICFPDWLSLNVELDCGEGGVVGGAEDIGGRGMGARASARNWKEKRDSPPSSVTRRSRTQDLRLSPLHQP